MGASIHNIKPTAFIPGLRGQWPEHKRSPAIITGAKEFAAAAAGLLENYKSNRIPVITQTLIAFIDD